MADEELEAFTAYSGTESLEEIAEYEGSNASRFAIAGTLDAGVGLDVSRPIVPLKIMARFGFDPDLPLRALRIDAEDRQVSELDYAAAMLREGASPDEDRRRTWRDLNEYADGRARLGFLVNGVVSTLERESVTASVATLNSHVGTRGGLGVRSDRPWNRMMRRGPSIDFPWRDAHLAFLRPTPVEDDIEGETIEWEGSSWAESGRDSLSDAARFGRTDDLRYAIITFAAWRVELARRSSDPIVRELAAAAFLRPSASIDASFETVGPRPPGVVTAERTSTMIHGTWGWKGDWWYPEGDFHAFIKGSSRPTLYGGGTEFAWSGAYSDQQREKGGKRFKRWADSIGGAAGLGTVFAHSYGAEVVARAVNSGAIVDELVLLSAPIHDHHRLMLDRVRRVIDVRLSNDIVLVLARAAQRLPEGKGVIEHIIERPFWSHGASHHPVVWRYEGIAASVGL
ncbi:hypothetical protein EDF36_3307 [Rathayibacter sp. PhB152]|uniref:hypothetical protein n=1 Tax=Rathayibacter sp. PhB152 TaxID=2485190 RepID=UPI000F9A3373|nr:hypothetical protein [Rathayibacter sp. PhB152]ROQ54837.1 hypothetical protein EDF36_3307 [Rathayibacter sp. PhB152]